VALVKLRSMSDSFSSFLGHSRTNDPILSEMAAELAQSDTALRSISEAIASCQVVDRPAPSEEDEGTEEEGDEEGVAEPIVPTAKEFHIRPK
jgi:hypothetical protein